MCYGLSSLLWNCFFLWNWSHVNATENLWWLVNIGLVLSDSKPSPESMLTNIYLTISSLDHSELTYIEKNHSDSRLYTARGQMNHIVKCLQWYRCYMIKIRRNTVKYICCEHDLCMNLENIFEKLCTFHRSQLLHPFKTWNSRGHTAWASIVAVDSLDCSTRPSAFPDKLNTNFISLGWLKGLLLVRLHLKPKFIWKKKYSTIRELNLLSPDCLPQLSCHNYNGNRIPRSPFISIVIASHNWPLAC